MIICQITFAAIFWAISPNLMTFFCDFHNLRSLLYNKNDFEKFHGDCYVSGISNLMQRCKNFENREQKKLAMTSEQSKCCASFHSSNGENNLGESFVWVRWNMSLGRLSENIFQLTQLQSWLLPPRLEYYYTTIAVQIIRSR